MALKLILNEKKKSRSRKNFHKLGVRIAAIFGALLMLSTLVVSILYYLRLSF